MWALWSPSRSQWKDKGTKCFCSLSSSGCFWGSVPPLVPFHTPSAPTSQSGVLVFGWQALSDGREGAQWEETESGYLLLTRSQGPSSRRRGSILDWWGEHLPSQFEQYRHREGVWHWLHGEGYRSESQSNIRMLCITRFLIQSTWDKLSLFSWLRYTRQMVVRKVIS